MVIVGQDWGDTKYFISNQGRDASRNRTNNTLIELLHSIGIEVPAASSSDSGVGSIFCTNAVLCLKEGGMQAKLKWPCFANCSSRFLKPTLDLVGPKFVISLGAWAYRAITAAYGLRRSKFRQAVESANGFMLPAEIKYFPMYHCAQRVLNKHRPLPQQFQDWAKVATALARSC